MLATDFSIPGVAVRGPMTPQRLLGPRLLAFWDAERVDSLALVGASVEGWTDLTGGRAATQSSAAARPIWSATAFQGRSGIVFDGVDDALTLAGVPFPSGSAPCEIWAVVDQQSAASDASERYLFAYGGDGVNDQRRLSRQVVAGINRAAVRVGSGSSNNSVWEGSVDFHGAHIVRGSFGGIATELQVDGGAPAQVSIPLVTGTSRVRIGTIANPSAGNFFRGIFSALLITLPLEASIATALLQQLKRRAGIS